MDLVNVSTSWNCWSPPSACVHFDVAKNPAREANPPARWIAYGVVVDDDGDGRADRRLGIDNRGGGSPFDDRMWRTDLATGTIEAYLESLEDPRFMDAVFPKYGGRDVRRASGRGSGRGSLFVHAPSDDYLFYVWASVIEDGVVRATDYAPDAGWIALAPREAHGTAAPSPAP